MEIISAKSIQGGEWKPAVLSAEEAAAALAKAAAFCDASGNMALAATDAAGEPSMKAVNVKARESLARIWFVTHRSSAHGAWLLERPRCSLLAFSGDTWEGLLLRGRAVTEEEAGRKRECWRDFYEASFPGGIDDPGYLCFRFETETAEYSDCSGPCVRIRP